MLTMKVSVTAFPGPLAHTRTIDASGQHYEPPKGQANLFSGALFLAALQHALGNRDGATSRCCAPFPK